MKFKFTTKLVPIETVIPYDRNPRKNSRAIAQVGASIKEFGFLQPIIVDEKNVIIAGHSRLQAAFQLGLREVPVHIAEGLSPEQVKAYRIADNRSGEIAEWNEDLLKLEMGELKTANYNLASTGFTLQDVDLMLAPLDLDDSSYLDVTTSPVREGRKPPPPDPETMEIGGYVVSITKAEFKRAIARVETHSERWGTSHGFVSSLLGLTVVGGLE